MSADRWQRVSEIYHEAIDRPVEERQQYVRDACAGDESLRNEVESLLAADRNPVIVDTPAFEVAARVLADEAQSSRIGRRLGVYQITAFLGAGGMGDVYRARDSKLGRDVAIKVLSQSFAQDPGWVTRFHREAKLLAALNHPNIGAIYGIEESGGVNALVLELVEGPTLAARLAHRPLRLDETVAIAKQVADALEAAHERGIVHRDVKPANIAVTPAGTVKVLDFGLASVVSADWAQDRFALPISASGTQRGLILGTAAYMSPEQARGSPVDKRTDIWAFGCVLYEMLTAKLAFPGDTLSDTIAAILDREPDWTALPAATPPTMRRLLRRCLEKDPRRRLHDIGDARVEVEDLGTAAELPLTPVPGHAKPLARPILFAAIATGLAVFFGAAVWAPWRAVPSEAPVVRFQISAPAGVSSVNFDGSALSPDGRHIVFLAGRGGRSSLWLRPLDSTEARPLPGTDDAILRGGVRRFPFWSPDSRSLAFFDGNGQLKRLEIAGGISQPLADLGLYSSNAVPATGTWRRDGVILFGSATGIRRMSASGGGVTPVTSVDPARKETGHAHPQFLPNSNQFLYFAISGDSDVQGVYSSSLDSPERRKLIVRTDARAVYVPPLGSAPAYLLWMRGDDLVAQHFDEVRLELQGNPVRVAEDVERGPAPIFNLQARYTVSEAGVLAYRSGTTGAGRIVVTSRDGTLLDEVPESVNMLQPVFSPDGTRLALVRKADGGNSAIGIWEFSRAVFTPLTFGKGAETTPVWSPDSLDIAFAVSGKGIYRTAASGAEQPELLLELGVPVFLQDWSQDGSFLLYRTDEGALKVQLWVLPVRDTKGFDRAKPFLAAPSSFEQRNARFSPNGKWIAYTSTETGVLEAYIQPFVPPGSGTVSRGRRVSNNGGREVAWRGDGKELYYETGSGDVMAVAIREDGPDLQLGVPQLLFKAGSAYNFFHSLDATRDGQKFVVQQSVSPSDVALTVIANWQALVR